ncbi:Endonuclease 2 [Sesamum angolense]|uniref:Aspergillus nuclease S1 n=1 Tax=Sesamum angolense TaxID=2727404 RepID=A0AAE1WVK8_9LAMI|nr:Endonuclease 2 [Sesamum angolense]
MGGGREARLSSIAAEAVKKLLPASAHDDLGRLCPWADRIKFRYRWSSDLHFVNTPDDVCSYNYTRDCKGRNGAKGRCLTGAINNYTTQLLSYRDKKPRYNLTEALLFLSHFLGDIHQPLHVGFASDMGGNRIKVTWFNTRRVLHHVWDTDVIKRDEGGFNPSNVDQANGQIKLMHGRPGGDQKTCPNMYAESIKAACQWAYKGVHPGSVLKDEYYETRLPIVEMRLAQAGIRLAATLNRIFT